MRGVVGLGEMLKIQVRINLRGRNARVTEHLLHGTQVAARLQHVRSEGVTQHVRMRIDREPLPRRRAQRVSG